METLTAPTPEQIAAYEKNHQSFIDENGLSIGDRVKITRKAKHWEENWNNTWTEDMDEAFDHVGVITDFGSNGEGMEINFPGLFFHRFNYPYFIVEVVENNVNA